ncbi:helix-turn-helix transcriptional regulator [Actinocorallia sp. B10E7]|uniref:helix-turn-helix domain-containing protein n=1 Tax=Actinocorallia sp. B10E7 TaxID=3153558 RepID=UPI00325E7E73
MYNTKEPPDPRLSLWAMMAFYVRFLRTRHGQSGDTVARWLRCSRSSVSRLESGESQLKDREAALLDEKWNTGGLFTNLLWYARLGHNPDWAKSYFSFERRASVLRLYDGQRIPALFQSPEYARALMVAGRSKDPDKAVAERVARQELLHRTDPPEVWVLLSETALLPRIGGAAAMRDQLALLLKASRMPHVHLRVVENRAGATEGLDGPFKVITVSEGDVGFTDATLEGRLITVAAEVTELRNKFDRIGMYATPIDSSQKVIERVMKEMS